MLTPEQIKKLKPGDPLVIHGTFEETAADGDICVKVPMSLHSFVDNNNINYVHPSAVSIIKPKHDPCRLFKKGDVVEPKQVKGRVYSKDSKYLISKKCIVFRDEDEPGYVVISHEGKNYAINTAYLELITPVEELEPYQVLHNITNSYVIYKDKPKTDNIVVNFTSTHPHAKEAAEAECARLNAEYRKEREND